MAQVTLNGSGFFIFDNQISTSQVVVNQNFTANTFILTLNTLYHNRIDNLTATLISPSSQQLLFTFPFQDGSFVNSTYSFSNSFTDDFLLTAAQVPDGIIVPSGNYYSPFTSQPTLGTWTLSISDNSFQNSGGLFSWNLTLSDSPPPPLSSTAVPFNFTPFPALILIIFITLVRHTLARR